MKVTRQGVVKTLANSGWEKHTRTSTSIRGYWHDRAGWQVNNAKAGEPIIIWHMRDSVSTYQADIDDRLSSYAFELRKAGYPAEIISDRPIHYIRIKREES